MDDARGTFVIKKELLLTDFFSGCFPKWLKKTKQKLKREKKEWHVYQIILKITVYQRKGM